MNGLYLLNAVINILPGDLSRELDSMPSFTANTSEYILVILGILRVSQVASFGLSHVN